MKQGEIWDVYLDPVSGSEQEGRRPCVIISGNLLNQHLQVVIICPLTTKIKRYKGNLLLNPDSENGLEQESEVLTFHVRSVSKERLDRRIGKINSQQVDYIKGTLDDILRY
ncbi:type II toxin-antitoxin system PemK/MazF family toxin [Salinimicrobium xinjiangense]|uniref:type II toxin-antitoxin system PemK/MazF family toxin n=1 Tax=Salinimicrobium xinjiangense TaxID=438596 RepID=UPI0003FBF79A|nr:type II toxin-antitoxin system PemK/MazF family toxin [Salinimicrobium xinjiangense]